ncbi:MAG: hypothetical protein ABJR46_15595 [Tateyamaria sp.]|uniref:hypothetical protein n=1 Tax=Tateyamaria sp. TaxID=1929288 RepID=UPI00327C8F4D
MIKGATLLATAITLTACAETTSETQSTYSYLGRTYPVVERSFQSANGSYSRRFINVGGFRVSCSATDDRDCDLMIFNVRQRFDGR